MSTQCESCLKIFQMTSKELEDNNFVPRLKCSGCLSGTSGTKSFPNQENVVKYPSMKMSVEGKKKKEKEEEEVELIPLEIPKEGKLEVSELLNLQGKEISDFVNLKIDGVDHNEVNKIVSKLKDRKYSNVRDLHLMAALLFSLQKGDLRKKFWNEMVTYLTISGLLDLIAYSKLHPPKKGYFGMLKSGLKYWGKGIRWLGSLVRDQEIHGEDVQVVNLRTTMNISLGKTSGFGESGGNSLRWLASKITGEGTTFFRVMKRLFLGENPFRKKAWNTVKWESVPPRKREERLIALVYSLLKLFDTFSSKEKPLLKRKDVKGEIITLEDYSKFHNPAADYCKFLMRYGIKKMDEKSIKRRNFFDCVFLKGVCVFSLECVQKENEKAESKVIFEKYSKFVKKTMKKYESIIGFDDERALFEPERLMFKDVVRIIDTHFPHKDTEMSVVFEKKIEENVEKIKETVLRDEFDRLTQHRHKKYLKELKEKEKEKVSERKKTDDLPKETPRTLSSSDYLDQAELDSAINSIIVQKEEGKEEEEEGEFKDPH